MTQREVKISRAVLDSLHDVDGSQLTEAQIHADVQLIVGEKVPLAELASVIAICESKKWVTCIKSKFASFKYNITDAGEAARLEMR
jgi:hypothetical protein